MKHGSNALFGWLRLAVVASLIALFERLKTFRYLEGQLKQEGANGQMRFLLLGAAESRNSLLQLLSEEYFRP